MKYINESYMNRINELHNKGEAYLLKNNISKNDWERFYGFYDDNNGMRFVRINGLTKDEKTELIMYGFYTFDEFFEIKRYMSE